MTSKDIDIFKRYKICLPNIIPVKPPLIVDSFDTEAEAYDHTKICWKERRDNIYPLIIRGTPHHVVIPNPLVVEYDCSSIFLPVREFPEYEDAKTFVDIFYRDKTPMLDHLVIDSFEFNISELSFGINLPVSQVSSLLAIFKKADRIPNHNNLESLRDRGLLDRTYNLTNIGMIVAETILIYTPQ